MCADDHGGQKKRCLILWSWNYRWLGAAKCGWEEPNSDPLQEQHVLVTAEQLFGQTLSFGDNFRDLNVSVLSRTGNTDMLCHASFQMVSRDLNSGPHVC